ncbi:MAG: RNA 2',3'-cyclic phosphodiesterase [Patescibacteria group bacterium]
MLHRVFIAINLPKEIKEELLNWQKKLPELPVRWTEEKNLHLTLAFLGNTSDKEVAHIGELMGEVGERHQAFSMEFTKIIYGPPKQVPRMVWVIGKESPELMELQKDVEDSLAKSGQLHFHPENRPFSVHLTLGRLLQWKFRHMNIEERPAINEEITLNLSVRSIEVMESHLKSSGSEYGIIQSFPLQAASMGRG